MSKGRFHHTTTLLSDDRVLIIGGYDEEYTYWSHCEISNPSVNKWTPVMNMFFPRYSHTSTLLSSGYVLITDGDNHNDFATCKLYNPQSKT